MRVDLRGFHARMTHEFLHGADIGASFDEVRGKAVAEGVTGCGSVDARGLHRQFYASLHSLQ